MNFDFNLNYLSCLSILLSTENATKFCNEQGEWERSLYEVCINTSSTAPPIVHEDAEYNTHIYCVGYICSIVALSLAVIIFLKFKWVCQRQEKSKELMMFQSTK